MSRNKPGRPRTRSRDLETITTHLTPQAKRRLKALAQVQGDPAYELVEQAFWKLWEDLPSPRRDAAEALIRLLDGAREEDSET